MIGKISVNTQSSIRIDAGKIIYFDPFRIEKASHDADIIFFTHDHYDHFSPEDYLKVIKESTVFVCPECINSDDAVYMRAGERKNIDGIEIEAVPAYNKLKPFHPKKNGYLGYIVTIDGIRIYVCGDTDNIPELENISCDIMLVPIGGTYTMDAKQAASLVNTISPKIVIPTHYGSIVGKKDDADKFTGLVSPDIKVVLKLEL